jgi:FMN phosphatase YigB (HAD superfamily)
LRAWEDWRVPLLFVFDMDDVLYDYDWRVRMAGLTELTGHDFTELRRRWWNDTGEWAAEAGGYADAATYHAAFTSAMGVDIPVDTWIANRRSAMTPWADSIAAVERAAELGTVSLLTNNGALVESHLAQLAPGDRSPVRRTPAHLESLRGAQAGPGRLFEPAGGI